MPRAHAGPVVRRFAAELVTQANVWTLLLAAPLESGASTEEGFLAGGAPLTRQEFTRLRAERDADKVVQELRRLLKGTALGAAMAAEPLDLSSLEQRASASRIAWLRALARRDPLGPAVVLSVLERIRAEARALRAIAWGVAFGAPAATLARLGVEAA